MNAFRPFAVLALVVAVLSAGAPPALADDAKPPIPPNADQKRAADIEAAAAAARQAAIQYDAAIAMADAKLALLELERAGARSQVDALAAEIAKTDASLVEVGVRLADTRATLAQLRADIVRQTNQLAARQALYAIHLRTTYRDTHASILELLLSASSMTDFANLVGTRLALDRQDVVLANEIRILRADTEVKRAAAVVAEHEIVTLQAQLTEQRERVAAQRVAFELVVKQAGVAVDAQSAARGDAVAGRARAAQSAQWAEEQALELARQILRAEDAYPELAAKLASASGLGAFSGTKFPVRPLDGIISSPFGPRLGGFHNGMDIAAPMYSPIVAAAAGIVVTVGHPYLASGDAAEVVIIAHGNDLSTLYGHLDDVVKLPPVKLGQKVEAGDVIGYVGMSGHTTGPHLHFMTIFNGKPIDPASFIPPVTAIR
ncbi:MAG: peptidoglycan DD-metalloendopeptidase family protein [Chloroflexota bacterium]|nr:peptidoglycan DD-metalloendopeptidase family protein [Chloroflexota bacterium]